MHDAPLLHIQFVQCDINDYVKTASNISVLDHSNRWGPQEAS